MSSSRKCPQCGLVNWANAEKCKRCALDFIGEGQEEAPEEYYTESGEQSSQAQGYDAFAQAQEPQRNRMAMASLILGVLGFVSLGLLGIGALVGFMLGITALRRARRNPSLHGDDGFAIAGIILNSLSGATFAFVLLIAAIAVPNLLASRRAANEAGAIYSLRQIARAEATYLSTRGMGVRFGTMQELVNDGLLEQAVAKGEKYGYRFELKTSGNSFEVTATPLTYGRASSPGRRSFYLSSDSGYVVRAADKKGLEADALDPPVAQSDNPYSRTRQKPLNSDYAQDY